MKTFAGHPRRIASLIAALALAQAAIAGSAHAATATDLTRASAITDPVTTVTATLSDSMTITLDRDTVPAGNVLFLVRNAGRLSHELVVLKTDLAANALIPNENEPGKVEEEVHMGETGDIAAGRFNGLQLTLGPGNYVLICNEVGHYMAGMRAAFTVIQPTVNVSLNDNMTITFDRSTIYAGPLVFGVTNRGTAIHEFVVLATNTPAGQIAADPAEAGKVLEEGNIGEVEVPAGRFSGLSLNLPVGRYLVICNEPGHFAGGMHFELTVLPAPGGDE